MEISFWRHSCVLKYVHTWEVDNVYRIGLMAELTGRANTAIHTVRSPGSSNVFSTRDLMLNMNTGNQHKASVRMMLNTRLASAVSLLVLVDLDRA